MKKMMTPKEEALDNLARAAQTYSNSDNWFTLDSLRYFAMKYVATELRLSDDNPDLARGGSVAAFVEQRAENFRDAVKAVESKLAVRAREPKTLVTFRDLDAGDYHVTRDEFIDDVRNGMLIDYDGFGNLATETQKSDVHVYPSDLASGFTWPEWATHVVWYNR